MTDAPATPGSHNGSTTAFTPVHPVAEAMIRLAKVNVWRSGDLVLSNINLTVRRGEWVALMGASGGGKSSLLRLLAGEFPRLDGNSSGNSSEHEGYDGLVECGPERLSHFGFSDLAYVPQNPSRVVSPWFTVRGNLQWVRSVRKVEQDFAPIQHLLRDANLHEDTNKYPNQLSGGTLKRLALALGLSYPSRTLLLDEPLTGVDLEQTLQFWNRLAQARQSETTCIFSTHNLTEAAVMADRVVFLHRVRTGPGDDYQAFAHELKEGRHRNPFDPAQSPQDRYFHPQRSRYEEALLPDLKSALLGG